MRQIYDPLNIMSHPEGVALFLAGRGKRLAERRSAGGS